MGGSLWATAVQDWEAGKMSYYGLKDKVDQSKEDRVFELVAKLLQRGKRVDVFYEAGRYGYWPARKLISLGANVHILPINKLQVIHYLLVAYIKFLHGFKLSFTELTNRIRETLMQNLSLLEILALDRKTIAKPPDWNFPKQLELFNEFLC